MRSRLCIAVLAAGMIGCSSHSAVVSTPTGQRELPKVVQIGDGSTFAFVPTPNLVPFTTVKGADRNLWFIGGPPGNITQNVYTISMTGVVTKMTNFSGVTLWDITEGSDKNTWFTDNDPQLGPEVVRLTPTGQTTFYGLPGPSVSSICTGPDGNLWFVLASGYQGIDLSVDRMTPDGVITNISLGFSGDISSITAGPDGGVWFTESGVNSDLVGRIDVHTLAFTRYDATGYGPMFGNIIKGRDGNLWTSRRTDGDLVRITPTGSFSSYPHGLPRKITNDNPWLVMDDGGPRFGDVIYAVYGSSRYIVRFSVMRLRQIDIIALPHPGSSNTGIRAALGPDSNVWTTDYQGTEYIAYILHTLTVSPTSMTLSVGASQTITASERHVDPSVLRATSSNPGIAAVGNGGIAGTFVVTGVAVGTCTVTIDDQKGNSVNVSVTVN